MGSSKRIALIAGGEGWHVQDLQRAALELRHETQLLDFRHVSDQVATQDHTLEDIDAILVRTMPPGSLEQVVFRMDVLHRLQTRGIPVLNPPRALELCIDKYLTTVRLHDANFPVPETIVCQESETALEAFEKLGRDVIVKPLFGSEGRGMMRITDYDLAWRTFRALERTECVLYLQRFVPHHGHDLRAFVMGDRILTAMKRTSDTWRANVAQGAEASPIQLTPEQEELALSAARSLNVPIAGVDLLPALEGTTYVLELNAVPGWRKLCKVTGVDVAREMIQFLVRQS